MSAYDPGFNEAFTGGAAGPSTPDVAPTSTAWASLDDLEALCLAPLTPEQEARAEKLLARAANRIRAYTGQTFDKVQTTDTLRALGSIVRLPQAPVVSIEAVQVIDYLGTAFPVPVFGWDSLDRLDLAAYGAVLNLPEALSLDALWSGAVKVTYTHGYDPVPAEIVDLNAELVARVYNSPAGEQTGIRSQGVGPYSVGYDPATGGGVLTLTPDDKAVLDRYRDFGATVELV